jgi:hypothetical protein
VNAQAKAISELLEDFEQSLENLRPSTRRVYLAGARAAIRAARLELWQCPSATELLASLGESPTEKRVRISPFLDFLGGGEPKELVSAQDSPALRNWVIQRLAKETRSVKNPSIATRRDLGLIAAPMRGACQGNSSKMAGKLPQNRGPRSASVGRGNRGTMLRSFLALLACLERAPGPAGPTAALPKISPLEPIKAPFPRAQRRSLEPGSPAQRSAATQRGRRAQQHWAHHSGEDQSRFPLEGSS